MNFSFPYENLKQMLEQQAQNYADKIYLFFKDKKFTYSQLNEAINKVANSLIEEGIGKQDKVCIHLTNCPEFIFTFFACFKIDAVAVPINPVLKSGEIEYILNNSDAKIVVSQEDIVSNILSIKNKIPNIKKIICVGKTIDGTVSFSNFIKNENVSSPQVEVKGEDIAGIIYTSGTTGKPKGVLLSHKNYLANTKMIVDHMDMRENDRFLCVLPLFHVNGQVVTTLSTYLAGVSLVLAPGFSASLFFDWVERYKVTSFSAVPTIYAMLLNHPDSEGRNLSSLRFCICGAAPIPVEVFNNFEKKFNVKIIEGYGLSEGTAGSTVNPLSGKRKIGSIGLPLKGQQVKIFDNRDNELPSGKIGEIVIKGPNVMQGYYKNESATKEVLKGGWLHSGDLGYIDKEGYLYIAGRKKEMIIRGGENIYPREIEEVLYKNQKILEASVIGISDKIYGEEVYAFVVPKKNKEITEKEIIFYCKERLADFKCPGKVVITDTPLPKTATGKIQKHIVKEGYEGRNYGE